ncbi:MAG: tetratricopeptide repeat protein [Gammaproteobacteria bacterium]|nr:tetratricopeptide repeat protein [Gammaproteobacteria bacterium]
MSCLLSISSLVVAATSDIEQGIEAFEQQDFTVAKQQFTQRLSLNTQDAVALQYLAKIALQQQEFDDAEEYIEQALKFAANQAEIHFDAALIMAAQAQNSSIFSAPGYAKKSLNGFKMAVQLAPSNLQYRQGLMTFYLAAPGIVGGDEALALVEALAIEKIDPVAGVLALADVYRNTDQTKELKQLFSDADKRFPNNAAILFKRVMYYQAEKQFDLAVNDFKKIQTIVPKDQNDITAFRALYQIGRSSVLSESDHQRGVKALESFIKAAPEHEELASKSWARYRLGLLYHELGDKNRALELYVLAKAQATDKRLIEKLKRQIKKSS